MALAAAMKALKRLGGDESTSDTPPKEASENTDRYESERIIYNDRIAALRDREYPQLKDTIYLDHAGTTIPSKSLIDAFAQSMLSNVIANPHSAPAASSQFSNRKVDDIRLRALRLFNASPDDFDLVFTANATAAIKLVGECLRDAAEEKGSECWFGYHKDAHTSLVGLREILARNATAKCFEDDADLEHFLQPDDSPENSSHVHEACSKATGLLAYPAQSNMDGRRLPLSWIAQARERGYFTLLDAAALVSTAPLDLSDVARAPDFTALSLYKIFGFPDLGALIVRKQSGDILRRRRYFGGGTVEVVTCLKEQWHIRKQSTSHEQLEDGTLPVHSIIALDCALETHQRLFGTMREVSLHTSFLASRLYDGLSTLQHSNLASVCKLYGDRVGGDFGPVVAFNILNSHGSWESNYEVEKLASIRNIQLRTGGVCNPGGIASALELNPWDLQSNFSSGQRCGGERDIQHGRPTGVVRVSLGALSTLGDVDYFLAFMREFFVESNHDLKQDPAIAPAAYQSFRVESLTVYPIKSCGGWDIPNVTRWSIRPQGLAWDREWCLVHPVTRSALSQKKYPRMALIRPRIDLVAGVLSIGFHGPIPPDLPLEVTVPLSNDPSVFSNEVSDCSSNVCGDDILMRVYSSSIVNEYLSRLLDTPCVLARFPSSQTDPSPRHAKPHLSHLKTAASPLLLSNESPILMISRSSLNRLNETIKSRSPPGRAASAAVFRANIILAEDASGFEQPYVEEKWSRVKFVSENNAGSSAQLDVLGPCRRCQMVCIDQYTAEKSIGGEPFASLAKTRRREGKVWFGVHSALVGSEAMIQSGDKVEAMNLDSDI